MNKGKLKAIFFLLIIVIIAFIGIRALNDMKKRIDINDTILKAVENTNWPVNDVPLISKENMVVNNLGEYNCEVNIPSGVTYDELRKYLIKLYDVGFIPYEELGSLDPNKMVPTSSAESVTEVSWIGQKDNYTINVLWAKDGAVDEFGIEYGFNLNINLFINPGNTDFSKQDDIEIDNQNIESLEENNNSGELEVSGDVSEIISGETENVGAEINNTSGEESSEDTFVQDEANNNNDTINEQVEENGQVEDEVNE